MTGQSGAEPPVSGRGRPELAAVLQMFAETALTRLANGSLRCCPHLGDPADLCAVVGTGVAADRAWCAECTRARRSGSSPTGRAICA
jgi:hypothetical protein